MSPPLFPESTPSSPSPVAAARPSGERVWLCRLVLFLLLAGSAALRIAFMASSCPLDLSPDEGHYWDWSRHPDWSYYSKGPVVAYLIGTSCALTESWTYHLPGQAMLSVRLPAVLCGCLLLLSVYVLTVLAFKREWWAVAAVALGLTLPPVTAVSEIMTIDAPFLCCWGWGLVFAYLALFRQDRWGWPMAGVMIAFGMLAKHTMVLFVPSLLLFLIMTPSCRKLLWRPGFWVMNAVASLGSLPILWWNYQHDWVNFKHLLGHGGFHEPTSIHWLGPLAFVGMQAALLMVYWFAIWISVMWVHRPWTEPRNDFRYLWWMSMPTFAFFLVFGLKNGGGEPNWPAATYLSGMVLTVGWLAEQLSDPRRWYRLTGRVLLSVIVALGLGLTVLIHCTWVSYPLLSRLAGPATNERPMPLRQLDPTCRLQGFRTLAAAVDDLRQELRERGEEEPVLAGDHWSVPGEVGFYCRGRPTVYSLGLLAGDRHSQYDFWRPNPIADIEAFEGRTFIIIGEPNVGLAKAFRKLEGYREVIHQVAGYPVNRWGIFIGREFHGAEPLQESGH